MLPHYSAFKVAETFRMLERSRRAASISASDAHPAGRASSRRRCKATTRPLPQQIHETLAYFAASCPIRALRGLIAQPAGETSPAMWVLGSSDFGARLRRSSACRIRSRSSSAATIRRSRGCTVSRFAPSAYLAKPYVMVTVAAIVAPTDDEADALVSAGAACSGCGVCAGVSAPFPSLAEAQAYPWTDREKAEAMLRAT